MIPLNSGLEMLLSNAPTALLIRQTLKLTKSTFMDGNHTYNVHNHHHLHQRLIWESVYVYIRSQSDSHNRDNGSMPQVYSSL